MNQQKNNKTTEWMRSFIMVAKKSSQAPKMEFDPNAPKGSQTTQPGKPGVKNPDTGEVVSTYQWMMSQNIVQLDGDPITSTEEIPFDKNVNSILI